MAAVVTGCTLSSDGPLPAAQTFLSDLAENDTDAAAQATDQPAAAKTAMAQSWSGLQAESLRASTGSVRVIGDTATVDYTYEWHLPKDRVWRYDGQLQMGRRNGGWIVRWTPTDLHPKLGGAQHMVLHSIPAPRARVNEHSGTDVLVPGVVHRIHLDAKQAGDIVKVATQLAAVLAPFDPTLTPQSIAESATSVKGSYVVATLSEDQFDQVQSRVVTLPGVSATDEADLVNTDPNFAPALVNQVKKTVADEVDGKAGWSVVTVNSNGAETDVLTETDPQPSPSFSISLDRSIQNAAQAAVDRRQEQAMMVVVQPSTGAILAIAQNKAADKEGSLATTGLYPPGSTFKMITAGAAISSGLATPATTVPCPGHIVIGERTIPNYDEFALGNVSMATAFARSCNTSFAKLASEMKPDALTIAASQYGIGANYHIDGLTADTGSVPVATDTTERTEDGFGQGKDLVTPFGMALAAATIAHGSTPVPFLIVGHDTKVDGDHRPISKAMVDGLRPMMRLVVTDGTGARIADQGQVYGKTGEAEFPGGSHAWFVGYRGDIAFATLVVNGGSSDNAVAVTRDMFTALPDGY
nr:penicillin-binding transpeptidase domain-containing protein [Skermania sp. ID1734]